MKLRKLTLKNYRSFKSQQTFQIDGDISIIIGPNGGGKSNLLDITSLLLRTYVLKSWTIRDIDPPNPHSFEIYPNNPDHSYQLQKHLDTQNETQSAEIKIEVTNQDINSINYIINNESLFRETLSKKYIGVELPDIDRWKANTPICGQEVSVCINAGQISSINDARAITYLEFLGNYEWIARIRSNLGTDELSTPLLLLPANRSANGFIFDIGLADWQENDYKTGVDFTSSRTTTNIVQLAVGRMASRYNDLLHSNQGKAEEIFYETAEAKGLTNTLESLGYGWKLKCRNRKNNTYTIELTKSGRNLSINEVSSGEKEILVLLFAIFGLNVRQAVLIIDEPELHLHPRLQKKVFQIFELLSKTTGNQFVLATHSATFVSPISIQYVSRIYNESAESKIIRLNDSSLPNAKHLFNIINSQNNESLFFADHVLLVEGLSDKIFFEKLIELFSNRLSLSLNVEIVPVGGKGLFTAYQQVLEACKIPYSLLADQDYLEQIGDSSIKKMLLLDSESIKKHVLKDSTSRDAATLVANIEKAMEEGDWGEAKSTWLYIKSRHLHIPHEIDLDQKKELVNFIEKRKDEGTYILSRGSLEAYLPIGHLSKDIEKLISLLEKENFPNHLPKDGWEELTEIMTHLLTKRAL